MRALEGGIFLKHGKNGLQPSPGVLYYAGGREYQIDRFLPNT